jgi:succinylglutamic semialdehyde dehydrogenase
MSHNIQLINGQWTAGLGHEIFSKNPAKNQVIWQGKTASPAQVGEAVMAARAAFETWSNTPIEDRIAIAVKFAELLTQRSICYHYCT